jgi:hypothetical protein
MGGLYSLYAVFATTCGSDEFGPIGYVRGGQPRSVTTAVALGAALWLTAGIATWRFPRWRGRIFVGVALLYASGLALLWALTPLVWGAGCLPVTSARISLAVLLKGHYAHRRL